MFFVIEVFVALVIGNFFDERVSYCVLVLFKYFFWLVSDCVMMFLVYWLEEGKFEIFIEWNVFESVNVGRGFCFIYDEFFVFYIFYCL